MKHFFLFNFALLEYPRKLIIIVYLGEQNRWPNSCGPLQNAGVAEGRNEPEIWRYGNATTAGRWKRIRPRRAETKAAAWHRAMTRAAEIIPTDILTESRGSRRQIIRIGYVSNTCNMYSLGKCENASLSLSLFPPLSRDRNRILIDRITWRNLTHRSLRCSISDVKKVAGWNNKFDTSETCATPSISL